MLTRRPEELELWKSDLACFQEKTQVATKKLLKKAGTCTKNKMAAFVSLCIV